MKRASRTYLIIIGLTLCCVAKVATPHTAFANSTIKTNVFDPTILGGPLLVCQGDPFLKDAQGNYVYVNVYNNECQKENGDIYTPPNGQCAPGEAEVTHEKPSVEHAPNPNACNNVCDLVAQILQIVYFIIAAAMWIVAPILVSLGGITIMAAGANPELLDKGKSIIKSTVIGLAIVLCSYILIAALVGVLGIKGLGGFGQAACVSPPPPATNTNNNQNSNGGSPGTQPYGCQPGQTYISGEGCLSSGLGGQPSSNGTPPPPPSDNGCPPGQICIN